MRTISIAFILLLSTISPADDAAIKAVNPVVFPADDPIAKDLPKTLSSDYRRRIQDANLRESKLWNAVSTKEEWEKFRDVRMQALRKSLAEFPERPKTLNLRVTGKIDGDGYRIEKLIYETRPGFWANAQLYLPAKPTSKMPGFIVAHSHHTPCTQGELQDLGIGWARVGGATLVPELVGHGERRTHPFATEKDYPKPFRPSRQDYWFRFTTGRQLQLVGDSLMGWNAWDLSLGIDVLLNHAGADKDRIILLGAVAGGGDPAGVVGALDPRVSCVVPYNFGGSQPETGAIEDADRTFSWFGGADWESTRALRLGARDGFAQWTIVAAAAPRPVILAHEFAWEASKDPAWPRFQKVYGFYNAADKLGTAAGKGSVKGPGGPDNTHCTHIGDFHRSKLDPYFQKWFGIEAPTKPTTRHTSEELACWNDALRKELQPKALEVAAGELFDQRTSLVDEFHSRLTPAESVADVRKAWASQLGNIEPAKRSPIMEREAEDAPGLLVFRFAIEADPGVHVPCVLLQPKRSDIAFKRPVVVMVAQAGKAAFLKDRAAEIEELHKAGIAVCLVDVRGTGETRPSDNSRGRNGSLPSISASEWLLGQTLLGSQLRDLRAVLRHLPERKDIDGSRIAVWGDSFAPTNNGNLITVPFDADPSPKYAEPMGGLLALFAALYEPEIVKAAYVNGGLVNFRSSLDSPFVYVPHDAIVPGAAKAGDLGTLAAALSPRPLRMVGLVDARNLAADKEVVAKAYAVATKAYESAKASAKFVTMPTAGESAVQWMVSQLQQK